MPIGPASRARASSGPLVWPRAMPPMGSPPSGQDTRAASSRVIAPMALSVRPRPGVIAAPAAAMKADSMSMSSAAPYQLKCCAHQSPGMKSPSPKAKPVKARVPTGRSSHANKKSATPKKASGHTSKGGRDAAATAPPPSPRPTDPHRADADTVVIEWGSRGPLGDDAPRDDPSRCRQGRLRRGTPLRRSRGRRVARRPPRRRQLA